MKLMVLDGNSIVNRAFYGVSQNLTTREGFPTNAIFGFLNILFKLTDEEKPDALCVTFDRKAPTFRHRAFAEYKAQRKGMPEELAAQMPVLKEVLDAMNIPRYEMDGWEADDLLGAIAARDTAAGWETVIVTGDKDALQLVTDAVTVKLVSTRMGQTTTKNVTPALFREEYGFEPQSMIDLKALMGDSSDNYPGVKGVGEKTAMALIRLYGTIDHLYDHMPDICLAPNTPARPGVVKKLTEGEADARLSHELATIRTDAPMEFSPEDARRRPYNEPVLYQKLLELEFSKLIDKLKLTPGPAGGSAEESAFVGTCESEMVDSRERMEELLALWRQLDHVSLVALPNLDGVCVEYGSEQEGRAALFFSDRLDCYNDFLEGLFAPGIKKAAHGVKDLIRTLLDEGLSTEGFVFDTELAAYLLDPTAGSYELERLSVAYFNFETQKAKAYLDPEAFGPLFAFHDAVSAGQDPYAGAEDREQAAGAVSGPMGALLSHTALVDSLYTELSGRLTGLNMLPLLTDLELPLCPVLAEMEKAGFLVDRRALADFGEQLRTGIDALETSIYELAGHKFNINSPKQLGVILFEEMGLPPVKKTKTGYSTSAEVLEKLRFQAPIVDQILEYRQLTKLSSTYVEGLGKVIGPDGRIHTSFQNTVTATGRLSSIEPNLQNIPVRTPLGAEMRKMFMAGPGNVLVDADYSQIELRLLAHIADDAAMQEAFNSGVDIHTMTASQVLGVPPEEVTKAERSSAKAVNFGIVYGISPFSLSQDIHVSVQEARAYMDRYFNTYSGVAKYQKDVVENAKRDGYVSTLLGRRRWIPELKSSNFNQRSFGERVALNAPIQGTAADVIKLAMIKVDRRLKAEDLQARLVLQVHDELIVECPEGEAETVKALLTEEMEGVMALAVPLTADAKAGKTWAEAH